jgi:outer membrane protein OmpA-like peptidoglycan-associated protein
MFNRSKVLQEKEFMAALKAIHEVQLNRPTEYTSKNNSSEVDKQIEEVLKATEDQVRALEAKIRSVDINSSKAHEEILTYMKELNDLLCSRVGAINKFLNKRVNKIFGDVSFNTGSSQVSSKGVEQISRIISDIEADIQSWRSYVNECNQNLFENDLFIVVINVDGYADQQGALNTNLKLSADRAKEVKKLITEKLNDLVVKRGLKIVFDKIYSDGHGEELPPGVQPKGQNDPNRRICLISSVVGPSKLLQPTK